MEQLQNVNKIRLLTSCKITRYQAGNEFDDYTAEVKTGFNRLASIGCQESGKLQFAIVLVHVMNE